MTKWTKQDTLYLIRNYGELSHKELATWLNKSLQSVSAKAFRLGLRKPPPTYMAASRRIWVKRDSSEPPWSQWNISKHVLDMMREGYV